MNGKISNGHTKPAELDSKRLKLRPVKAGELKPKPTSDMLSFGKQFTDHMLRVHWCAKSGWSSPVISRVEPLMLHPAAKVLNYGQEVFEGMKAFRGHDNKIRLFRPMHNLARLHASAYRAYLPTFDKAELLKCIVRLLQVENEWVPDSESTSLYIRPLLIGTEATLGVSPALEAELIVLLSPVGSYYGRDLEAIKLYAGSGMVRAWQGGCGMYKMGSNYAPTLMPMAVAKKFDCQQILWIFGTDNLITEAGVMNVFFVIQKEDGKLQLVTPGLERGLILPGVTRRSILDLTHDWAGSESNLEVAERDIHMKEIVEACESGNLVEAFGSGTASIVSRISGIVFDGKQYDVPVAVKNDNAYLSVRLVNSLSAVYYGKCSPHDWAFEIEDLDRFEAQIAVDDGQETADVLGFTH